MSIPKKRAAQAEVSDPPDANRIRREETSILGLATEEELRTKAVELWASFKPKKNQGTKDLGALMKFANLNDIGEDKLQQAERWMLDVGSASATNDLGENVFMRTDGVPGYVTELFRNAIGKEPSSEATLFAVVKRCFSDLEKDLAQGGKSGAKVALECMDMEDWMKFADYGLSPSGQKPPPAPVLSLLFDLLRSELQDEAAAYTSMPTSMANLDLSRSSTWAVYQEQVPISVFQGETIVAKRSLQETSQCTTG